MIPNSVKIGGYEVKIQHVKNLMTDNEEAGNFNPRTMVISLDPELSDQIMHGVFYHEIIEGIKEIYHIDCLKKDHHPIDQLGDALYQFLRDNPGLQEGIQ
jgi:hypothetical protein